MTSPTKYPDAISSKLDQLLDKVGDLHLRGSKFANRWTIGVGRHMGVTYESFDHEGHGDTIAEAINGLVEAILKSSRVRLDSATQHLADAQASAASLQVTLGPIAGVSDDDH
jgi:erythromycin esterase-like protein